MPDATTLVIGGHHQQERRTGRAAGRERPCAQARPLRVALFATPVQFGGIERVVLMLLQHMDPSVDLFPILFTRTDAQAGSFFDALRTAGVSHEKLFVNTNPIKHWNAFTNIADTIGIFKRRGFDLIHSHGYRANMIALTIAKCFGLPVVSTCHGFINTDRNLRAYNRADAFLLRYFTRVIAVSGRIKDELVAAGVSEPRIDVVTNAVAETVDADDRRARREVRQQLAVADDDFVFGFAGRLSEEKGVEYLVRAAQVLAQERPSSRLVILGDGPLAGALEQSVRAVGLSRAIQFVGFQSDTARWYSAMDAFVLPSLTEGTPMALLEAMACRLPVIATAVGGVPAILSDHENGILIPPADHAALLDAMRVVANDPALRARLSNGAIGVVRERYGVEAWKDGIRRVYASAVSGGERNT
jgi:glycosyltransferase involved in cell wall biosynthesis